MKTIEEAARQHAVGNKVAENSFIKGAKFTLSWISVDDELPEIMEGFRISEDVICKKSNGECVVGFYHYALNSFMSSETLGLCILGVTHWRRIEF